MVGEHELRERVAKSVSTLGATETARRLKLSTEATLRLALPGARVQRGTVAQAEQRKHHLPT